MELRHFRYFVAIAEEGSLSVAAKRRLHTAQPSLSRQMRDLEHEVGVPLMTRSARGIELTEAGKVFLEHARIVLTQVDAAREAARRAAKPAKPVFAVGFLSGQEVVWLPEATRLLAPDLRNIEMTVSSEHSPDLGEAVSSGRLDMAFMRAEPGRPDLDYVTVETEKFVAVLPSDHRLAAKDIIDIDDIVGETFIGGSPISGEMKRTIDEFLAEQKVSLEVRHQVHNLTMAMSLVASTRGVALLPAYAEKLLPWSVTSRPLRNAPVIDLVVGYRKSNPSPVLARFLSKVDQLVKR